MTESPEYTGEVSAHCEENRGRAGSFRVSVIL